MTELERIRALPSFRDGQIQELYRVGERLVIVSTVPDTGHEWDGLLGFMAAVIGPGDPSHEYAVDRESELEETMAFPSDGAGERLDSTHIVAAQGEGSRVRVLEMLAAGVSWRDDWPHSGGFDEKRAYMGG